MAYAAYITIKGKKQGQFKGESHHSSMHGKIPVLSFSFELDSPRDSMSGQASGKRHHRPIRVVKEWGAASPQIFSALVSNEVLDSVVIELVGTNPDGSEHINETITLTNAMVAKYDRHPRANSSAGGNMVEEVLFTFENVSLNGAMNVALSPALLAHSAP